MNINQTKKRNAFAAILLGIIIFLSGVALVNFVNVPVVAGSKPQFLEVAIIGPDKLGVNQTGTYTANITGGRAPYSILWTVNGSETQSETLNLVFPKACQGEMVYVTVTDAAGRHGYAQKWVADPYTAPDYYLAGSVAPYSYMIQTDGLGWYRAINGTDGNVVNSWTSTNASDVFNNAIATLTSGGKIFAKSGTYTLSNSIINGGTINNVIFEGEGDTTQFVVNANTNITAISIANATGWKFRNFYLDGNHANNVQNGGTGPLAGYGEIQQDMYQNGIHFWYVSNSEIFQVTVNNTVQHAINIHAYCGNNIISQCRIENGGMTGAYTNDAGILVWDHSNNNTVTNNIIVSPYCNGIYTSVSSSFNTFTGNQIIPNQGNLRGKGILVVTGCTNDIIANNNIQVGGTGATDYIPIFIDGISSGGVTTLIQVIGNTINYPYTTAPAPKGMGIRFDAVTYSTIANNIISNTGMSAILMLNASNYNTVTGNVVWNSSQLGTGVQRNGTIELESGSSYNIFTGNLGYGPAANFGYYELDNTCDNNTVTSCSFKNYNFGIRPMGANTKVNLCWNGTTWIP